MSKIKELHMDMMDEALRYIGDGVSKSDTADWLTLSFPLGRQWSQSIAEEAYDAYQAFHYDMMNSVYSHSNEY